jgi:exodeoxyribonuclease VII large subunit
MLRAMPEILEGKKIYSLVEVSQGIQETISRKFPDTYWIKAEMHKLGYYAQSGHCFPELVEKRDGKIIAKLDAFIWKNDYININLSFRKVLNDILKDGIKILFLAKVEYSTEFGLKLRILDIDAAFTLGDFERERQESIKRLQAEGIFNRNKSLEFPMLPKRIAIISDKDSRGYQDFMNVFDTAKKAWGYNFFHMLFTASLQGEKALSTIPMQLDRILKVRDHFDIVAIIRGGGGELTFACYNNYELSKKIATYPLPIVTGIGHVTNMTVVDMVANESSITPTKLAEYLIQRFHNFSVPVKEAQDSMKVHARRMVDETKTRFDSEAKLFRSVTANLILKNKNAIRENSQSVIRHSQFIFGSAKNILMQSAQLIKKDTLAHLKQLNLFIDQNALRISNGNKIILKSEKIQLDAIEKNINNMSPKNVLKRGYSITLLNGKAVTASGEVKKGDTLHTVLHEGSIQSVVSTTTKSTDQ